MTISPRIARPLGTMIACGFERPRVEDDLTLARTIGATCVELFPLWRALPDPATIRRLVGDFGLTVHSAHGCWSGQTIRARRVDLASPDEAVRLESVEEIRRCVAWLAEAGGRCLVVHPGGLSPAEAIEQGRALLSDSLGRLIPEADDAGVVVCVENMPPGVHPGSRMADLAAIVGAIGHPTIALAIDTGHAQMVDSPASETLAAGSLLRTTHVHDNDGLRDVHWAPFTGTIDWPGWIGSLDAIGYEGPIMLECMRQLRANPESLTAEFIDRLGRMAGTA